MEDEESLAFTLVLTGRFGRRFPHCRSVILDSYVTLDQNWASICNT